MNNNNNNNDVRCSINVGVDGRNAANAAGAGATTTASSRTGTACNHAPAATNLGSAAGAALSGGISTNPVLELKQALSGQVPPERADEMAETFVGVGRVPL